MSLSVNKSINKYETTSLQFEEIKKLVNTSDWEEAAAKLAMIYPNIQHPKQLLKAKQLLMDCEKQIDNKPSDSDYLKLINTYTVFNMREQATNCATKITKIKCPENKNPHYFLELAVSCIQIGALGAAEKLSAAQSNFSTEGPYSKIDFYTLLACNYLLNDYLKVKQVNIDEDFGLNAKRVLSTVNLPDKDTVDKIILLLQNFPNIITNVKNRVSTEEARLIAEVISQKSPSKEEE